MVLRDGSAGLEVFMLRRSAKSPFAPDAFVFPGGTVDEADAAIEQAHRTFGLTLENLEGEFRMSTPLALPCDVPQPDSRSAAGLLRAALREVFEESGILLARDRAGQPVDAAVVFSTDVQSQREQLRRGELAFDDMLAAHDWHGDASQLALFSHWITPPTEPRRYDTFFFVVRAPADQAGTADRFETHDERWIAPRDALARNNEGTMHLVYPTIKHLERLAAFAHVADALAFARSKPILTIMPTCAPDEGFVMPAELEGAW